LRKRWKKKIEDVIPLAERHLLVFFRDGMVRKCSIMPFAEGNPALAPVLRSDSIFCSVAVQTDGYGVRWSEQAVIDSAALYRVGVEILLSLNDFCSLIANRVVNSTEAAEMLGCSRQNIDDLTKRGKLHPVRVNTRNTLFLKNEIQQRRQQ